LPSNASAIHSGDDDLNRCSGVDGWTIVRPISLSGRAIDAIVNMIAEVLLRDAATTIMTNTTNVGGAAGISQRLVAATSVRRSCCCSPKGRSMATN